MHLFSFPSSTFLWFYFLIISLIILDKYLIYIVHYFSTFLFSVMCISCQYYFPCCFRFILQVLLYNICYYTVQNIFWFLLWYFFDHVIFRIYCLISEDMGNFLVTSFWMIFDINALWHTLYGSNLFEKYCEIGITYEKVH